MPKGKPDLVYCSVPDCGRRHKSHGYCDMHLRRWQTTGSTDQPLKTAPLMDRFWAKVDKKGPDPHDDPALGARHGNCWIWTGSINWGGYGQFWNAPIRRVVYAHVFLWEHLYEAKPAGLDLDHFACDRRECVRPAHLRLATRRENALRGFTSVASINEAKGHCPQGHPYGDSDLVLVGRKKNGDGTYGRRCKICRRKAALAYYYRKQSQAKGA